MCPSSEFQERIDTLDLIIKVLKEHEKILDRLAERLGSIVDDLKARGAEGEKIRESISLIGEKISSLNDALARYRPIDFKIPKPARFALVKCKEWADFKDKSRGARRVAFEIEEKTFSVNALSGEEVFKYSEALPEHEFHVKEEEKRYVIERMFVDSIDHVPLILERRLRCGLEVSTRSSRLDLSEVERVFRLTYYVDSDRAKHWLSKELEVSEENIVEGEIIF